MTKREAQLVAEAEKLLAEDEEWKDPWYSLGYRDGVKLLPRLNLLTSNYLNLYIEGYVDGRGDREWCIQDG